MGATLKTLAGPEEASAVGVSVEVGGVLVVDVKPGSRAAGFGLKPMDLIQTFQWKPVRTFADLQGLVKESTGSVEVGLRRNQLGASVQMNAPLERPILLPPPAPATQP
jgi:S1-C subfamily serine protease